LNRSWIANGTFDSGLDQSGRSLFQFPKNSNAHAEILAVVSPHARSVSKPRLEKQLTEASTTGSIHAPLLASIAGQMTTPAALHGVPDATDLSPRDSSNP
jgi:hypothetical protein